MVGSPMLIAATITTSLLVGGLLTLPFSLKAAIGERLRLADTRFVWLSVCFTAALMLFMFLGGVLVDGLGSFQVMILGSLLGGGSMVLLGLSVDEKKAWGAAAALGASTGMLHTAVAVVMPTAFFTFDQAPASTNFGYIFVVLGGLLMPFLSWFLVRKIGFRNGLLILALVSLVPAGCILAAGRSAFPMGSAGIDIAGLVQDGRFWLALVAVFFLYAVEISALQWATRYLTEVGFRPSGQTIMLVGFWAIFILARLFSAAIFPDAFFSWLLLLLTLVSAMILGNMIGMFQRASGGVSFLLLAACLGPLFPTLVGLIFQTFPTQPAVAFGLICSLGTAGRLVAEPVMNQPLLAERVRLAIGVTMAMVLVIAIPALVLVMF